MISWVRRARLIVPVAAVALVAAGCVDFTGSKVITGEGTPTGDFVVRITCLIGEGADAEEVTQDLTFDGAGTQSTPLPFIFEDSEGVGSCFVTEVEQAGATSVTYQCGDADVDAVEVEIPGDTETSDAAGTFGGPGRSLARGGDPVTCTETPDGLEYDVDIPFPGTIDVDFTVINDFEAPPPTTTTAPPTPAAVEAVAPTPVPAQVVAFTG